MEFTESQKEALSRVMQRHNVAILGQCGTGKTALLKQIYQDLSATKCVGLTATTGIAALNLNGKTIHSWAGLLDGRYSNEELLQKLQIDENYKTQKENILNVDCLIIDEISMFSAKLFSQLEFLCRKLRGSETVFGGVQVIVSGDFYQLPPVPDTLNGDKGENCFESYAWKQTFGHKIILSKVVRQSEPDLIKLVNDVSIGKLPEDSCHLLKRLSRSLPPGLDPVRLSARNFDADIFNACKLMDLEGDVRIFHAVDEGSDSKLRKLAVPKVLALKVGCDVMLLKNMSEKLVNGLRGTVQEIASECVTVQFGEMEVGLTIQSFTVYSGIEKRVVATRRQFPLRLGYAITIHKSQGLTLERVEVDCSNIFLPGQLGVAIGRATCKKGLRIINFNENALQQHSQALTDFYMEHSDLFEETLNCCRNRKFECYDYEDLFEQWESDEMNSEMSEFSDGELVEIDSLINNTQEENVQTPEVSLPSNTADATLPNIPFDPVAVLHESMSDNPETEEQKTFNNRCGNIIGGQTDALNKFTSLIIHHIKKILTDRCTNKEKIESKDWTQYYAEVYKFSVSDQYKKLVQNVTHSEITPIDFKVFGKIFDKVTSLVLQEASETVSNKQNADVDRTVIPDISDSGKGKIRYIGGRCVAKAKYHHMKIAKHHLYNVKNREISRNAFIKVKLLDSASEKYSKLKESSRYVQTLIETKRKQNINEGLTNITDSLYEFIMFLDEKRRRLQTDDLLNKFGGDILIEVLRLLLGDGELKAKFISVFSKFGLESTYMAVNKDTVLLCIESLFKDIVRRFCRIADDQYRKQMKNKFGRIKTDRLRKKVVSTKESKSGGKTISMKDIFSDTSDAKQSTHYKLKSIVYDKKTEMLEKFLKSDLVKLCRAYEVDVTLKLSKSVLVDRLKNIILNSDSIPKPEHMKGAPVECIEISTSDDRETTQRPSESITERSTLPIEQADRTVNDGKKQARKKRKSTLTVKRSKEKSNKLRKSEYDICLCASCNRQYKDNEDWIQCDICDSWYDRYCLELDDEKWEEINNSDDDWYCQKCV